MLNGSPALASRIGAAALLLVVATGGAALRRLARPPAPETAPLASGMTLGARRALLSPSDPDTLTTADLEALEGFGPKLASAITEERRKGPFGSVEGMGRVKGLGPAKLEKLHQALHPRPPTEAAQSSSSLRTATGAATKPRRSK